MEIKPDKIGIWTRGPGWGDSIITASLPENYYRNTGFKLIDANNHFVYDYNPYILRGINPDITFTNTQIQDGARLNSDNQNARVLSIADRLRYFFNLPECYLRHPRLYKYEDSETILDKITLQSSAKTIGGEMSDQVMEVIKNNYKKYRIFQLGGKNDKKFPGSIDLRGLSFWETAREISESSIFIGIDSSNLHIATAYPKVRKKVINYYFDEAAFKVQVPMLRDASWMDFGYEIYNTTERDVGVSMSYLKI